MSDRDNITLPREVVQEALEALGEETAWFGPTPKGAAAITALRTALAAPKQEPVAWLSRDEARLALWKAINSREFGNPTDDKLILDHLRQQGLWIGKVTSPVPPDAPTVKESLTHPGYIIGSHWLETAYSRICAGEAEADVLRDCGWERVDDALRRDAERLWEALKHYGKHDDDCGDHDAYNSESLRHCGCGLDAVLDETLGEKR